MTTLLIADLHLQEGDTQTTEKFFHFLNEKVACSGILYILGDLFEAWIGDDDNSVFNRSIIEALKNTVSKGVSVYLLPGNRDFLLGERFEKESGVKILADPAVVEIEGVRVSLTHGNVLCTQDRLQQVFRAISNNKCRQKLLIALIPLFIRRKLAAFMRALSKKYNKRQSGKTIDATPEAIRALMEKDHTRYLIHAHTHEAGIHSVELSDGKFGVRIVLGAWQGQGEVAICKKSHHSPNDLEIVLEH